MKAGDRLTIHHWDVTGRLQPVPGADQDSEGVLALKLPDPHPVPEMVCRDGPFRRWLVVSDAGTLWAVWVHEDHLIDPGPPALFDSSEGNATAVRFNQGSEITGTEEIRVEINGPEIPKILSVADVVLVVANVYRMAPEKLAGRSRQRDVLIPRQIAMALARRYTSASAATIAGELNRDHSAYAGAVRKIEGTEDPDLLRQIVVVEKRLDVLVRGRLITAGDRPITFADQELPDGLPVPSPPEIQALYHLLDAAKLFKSAPLHAAARDVIRIGQGVANFTPGSTQWCRDTKAWIDSLGEEGGS